ncbi:MAG: cupin domain-containing protein [archaeon]
MIENYGNVKELIEYPKNGILSKNLIKNPKLNVTLFCMAKSTSISDHTSTKEGFVYIIEGKGIFKLKNEEIKMLPGVIIHLSKNIVHSLKADENTSFLLALK